mgnify:CR=1 FL=1
MGEEHEERVVREPPPRPAHIDGEPGRDSGEEGEEGARPAEHRREGERAPGGDASGVVWPSRS